MFLGEDPSALAANDELGGPSALEAVKLGARRRRDVVVKEAGLLGLLLHGCPPGRIIVAEVHPRAADELQGSVPPRSWLFAVNGVRTDQMRGQAELEQALRARPLKLSFEVRGDSDVVEGVGESGSIGCDEADAMLQALETTSVASATAARVCWMATDGCASKQGVRLGDVVFAINGMSTSGMSAAAVREALRDRPLLVGFGRQTTDVVEDSTCAQLAQFDDFEVFTKSTSEAMGIVPSDLGGTWVVGEVITDGVAAARGVQAGDELLAAGGRSLMSSKMTATALHGFLETGPVAVRLRRKRAELHDIGSRSVLQLPRRPAVGRYQVFLGAADKLLGIVPDAWPPGPVLVRDVAAGSPAHALGVRPGDALLMVAGRQAATMSRAEFVVSLSKRPVTIHFATGPLSAEGGMKWLFVDDGVWELGWQLSIVHLQEPVLSTGAHAMHSAATMTSSTAVTTAVDPPTKISEPPAATTQPAIANSPTSTPIVKPSAATSQASGTEVAPEDESEGSTRRWPFQCWSLLAASASTAGPAPGVWAPVRSAAGESFGPWRGSTKWSVLLR